MKNRATVNFLVTNMYKKITGDDCIVSHYLGTASFFETRPLTSINEQVLNQIQNKLLQLIKSKEVVTRKILSFDETLKFFQENGNARKVALVKKMNFSSYVCAQFDDFVDVMLEPFQTELSEIGSIAIKSNRYGFAVWVNVKENFIPNINKYLQNAIVESKDFNNNNGNNSNYSLTQASYPRNNYLNSENEVESLVTTFLNTAYPKSRIICVTGPYYGGKTKLSISLKEALIKQNIAACIVSIDNYKSLDEVASVIKALLRGEIVSMPSSTIKENNDEEKKYQINHRGIVIIDGEKSISPQLIRLISPETTFKVFAAPLTPLSFDDDHPLSLTDICMARFINSQIKNCQNIATFEEENKFVSDNLDQIISRCDYFFNTFSSNDRKLFKYHFSEELLSSINKLTDSENLANIIAARRIVLIMTSESELSHKRPILKFNTFAM